VSVDTIPYEALGRPIRGPSALTDDWARFWHLTYNIALTQWKLRFFGSVLGYVWQLMRPLLLFAVLYIFFTKIAHVGEGLGAAGDYYGAQLLGSVVLFTFFAESTGVAVRSVLDAESLVRKIQFPRLVVPLSVVLVSLFNLTLNLVVVLLFAMISGVTPMWSWLELPLLVIVLALFATGFAMLLSSMFVYFRDIQPIWEVITQILFYASPIIVPLETIQKKLSPTLVHLYMCSPIATVLQQFRHAIINHAAPSAAAALGGGPIRLLAPLFVVAVICAIGFRVFNRTAPQIAENL
jgi:ABC-2 type transport system permease protein